MPVNSAQRDILKAGGVWVDFYTYREELKDMGKRPKDAQKVALEKYIPAAEANIDPDKLVGPRDKELAEKDKKDTTPAAKGVSSEGEDNESSPSVSNEEDKHEKLSKVAEKKKKKREERAKEINENDGVSKVGGKEIPQDIMDSKADSVRVIEYVAKYLEEGFTNRAVKEAPCAAAVSMLKSYSINRVRKNKFWDEIYTKLIPSKSKIDQNTTESFDGESIAELSNEILDKMKGFKKNEAKSTRVSGLLHGREEPGLS